VIRFLDLHSINARQQGAILAAITRVLDSGQYLQGNELAQFEIAFGRYCGASHCVGVGSGLDALSLTLQAWIQLGLVQPGDEVIVPGNTFIATILAITHSALRPVLVDPDPATHNLGVEGISGAISGRTRVILPVHLYGRMADMDAIMTLSRKHDLLVLEDAAQAHGAKINGRMAGNWGHAAAFSFYPAKNLGSLGDAGAVTTSDASLADMVRLLGNYGAREKYKSSVSGCNSRMDEIQAAVLREKLQSLDDETAHRRKIARIYGESITLPGLKLPEQIASHAWHLYVVQCRDRDRLRADLDSAGIETMIHYPVPPHLQEVYADSDLANTGLAVTEQLSNEVMSLPIGSHLDDGDVHRVCRVLNSLAT
jgi:dTDP-4-amino-4,6-dideoxygalactose transaminase